jgi:hypothetical protein
LDWKLCSRGWQWPPRWQSRDFCRRPHVHAEIRGAGAPPAVAGSGATATWDAPLNLDSNYAKEARSVAKKGAKWLASRSKVPNRAIVLDVDDTTLTT